MLIPRSQRFSNSLQHTIILDQSAVAVAFAWRVIPANRTVDDPTAGREKHHRKRLVCRQPPMQHQLNRFTFCSCGAKARPRTVPCRGRLFPTPNHSAFEALACTPRCASRSLSHGATGGAVKGRERRTTHGLAHLRSRERGAVHREALWRARARSRQAMAWGCLGNLLHRAPCGWAGVLSGLVRASARRRALRTRRSMGIRCSRSEDRAGVDFGGGRPIWPSLARSARQPPESTPARAGATGAPRFNPEPPAPNIGAGAAQRSSRCVRALTCNFSADPLGRPPAHSWIGGAPERIPIPPPSRSAHSRRRRGLVSLPCATQQRRLGRRSSRRWCPSGRGSVSCQGARGACGHGRWTKGRAQADGRRRRPVARMERRRWKEVGQRRARRSEMGSSL